jgi:hypothetical protein
VSDGACGVYLPSHGHQIPLHLNLPQESEVERRRDGAIRRVGFGRRAAAGGGTEGSAEGEEGEEEEVVLCLTQLFTGNVCIPPRPDWRFGARLAHRGAEDVSRRSPIATGLLQHWHTPRLSPPLPCVACRRSQFYSFVADSLARLVVALDTLNTDGAAADANAADDATGEHEPPKRRRRRLRVLVPADRGTLKSWMWACTQPPRSSPFARRPAPALPFIVSRITPPHRP